jgi:arabinoxylan arabinofuranohydrolase
MNPISPPGVYIADPSAHVWKDGRLWVYGSVDEVPGPYCSSRQHALSTSDLENWTLHEDIFSSSEITDTSDREQGILFAPDAGYADGRYFMYYCLPDGGEGVAVADNPEGPFRNGERIDTHGHAGIDPAVFVDDDGQAYYLWGQFSLKIAKLNPDMRSLDPTSLHDGVLTAEEHSFHEGIFMAKHGDVYILMYTSASRSDTASTIEYSTSKAIHGPYAYRGVILDNRQCNPRNWNNHGSLVSFKDQWFILYHRSTHGCKSMRKACIEPITIGEDGFIPEVEMSTQGAGPPVDAFTQLDAARACLLYGSVQIRRSGKDAERLEQIADGDWAMFKYLDFGPGAASFRIRVQPGTRPCRIVARARWPWGKILAEVKVPAADSQSGKALDISVPAVTPDGVHGLCLVFHGEGEELCSLESLQFGR